MGYRHPRSVGAAFRERRWRLLVDTFPDLSAFAVLDLGGTVGFWLRAVPRPGRVTVVNIREERNEVDWIEYRRGDACRYEVDRDYDLAFSNSLIEHVGGHARRVQLAETIRGAAPRYWVQTPYRYFPVEPHYLLPLIQFAPASRRAWAARRWRGSCIYGLDAAGALEHVMSTELVGFAEMRHYFPDATVWAERVGGIPKSLIAVKTTA